MKGSPLLPLLRRIRRRVRIFAAIEGGISGGAVVGLALAAGIAIVRRHRGAPALGASTLPILLGLTGVLIGAVVRATRRIPLARCARIADAALDGQERVLSAWCLAQQAPSPLVAALVADALGTASRLAPGDVVPARRPEGLPALGLAVLALGGAVLFPVSSRAARTPRPLAPVERRPPLGGALDVEREEARAALAEAGKRGDAKLAALAADFERAVRGLSTGTLADGEALDLLRALEARAAEAARDAERDGRAANAAARALGENPQTKAAGQALRAGDEGASERARAALGASAGAQPAETGRALAAAARGVARSSSEDAGEGKAESGPRRLARSADRSAVPPDQGETPADGSGTRHLEQLRRDLDDAAAACRDGDPSCRARAETRAQDLARLGRQAASADGLRRLERAAGQTRARVSRGELREGDALAARDFGRAANGESQRPGDDGANQGADPSGEGGASRPSSRTGDGDPRGDREGSGAGAEAQAAALPAGQAAGAQASDGTGDGIGKEAGGAPLGGKDDTGARGNETEAHLASGGGPTRASVIGAAAGRGFVAPGYARVFTDYAAAVEDALGTGAVPEGKRFIVRRYFDLIRPRSPR